MFQINIIIFNNLNLTTLSSINQNLPKCLYCISKELIRSPLLLKQLSACDMYVLLSCPHFIVCLQILDTSMGFKKKVLKAYFPVCIVMKIGLLYLCFSVC